MAARRQGLLGKMRRYLRGSGIANHVGPGITFTRPCFVPVIIVKVKINTWKFPLLQDTEIQEDETDYRAIVAKSSEARSGIIWENGKSNARRKIPY